MDINSQCSAPRYLYKYLSHESFLKIATQKTFKWSLPTVFNDPFDLQVHIGLGVTEEEARTIIATRFARLALHVDERDPQVDRWGGARDKPHLFPDTQYPLAPLLAMQSSVKGMSLQAAANRISDEYATDIANALSSIRHRIDWITDLFSKRAQYILCFSELYDSILMWAHYGKHHTGVVIEIDTAVKNALHYRMAKCVKYQTEIPGFFQKECRMYYQAGLIPPSAEPIHHHAARVKSAAWSYEKEWRLMGAIQPGPGVWFEESSAYYPFFSEIISGVYVGCKANDEMRKVVYEMTRRTFPHANLWQADRKQLEYELAFVPII